MIQQRNAGQAARWQELKVRLEELLSGQVSCLEELDASLGVAPMFYFSRTYSGSRIRELGCTVNYCRVARSFRLKRYADLNLNNKGGI